MKLPVDFEQKVKLPPAINGRSYPYQISANHLMQNFRYSALQVDGAEVGGLKLTETTAIDGTRTVKLDGSAQGGSDIAHEWKVRFVEDGLYSVAGGTVYSQGDPITLSDDSVSIESGFIYLKIERDEVTRELFDLTIESGSTMPSSTQQYQYIALAIVGGFPDPIIQLKFEEIRIFEDLVVVNGEFQLIGLEVSDRNTYSLP
jgi:hypothetical protein